MTVSSVGPSCAVCAQNARDARLARARAEAAERRIDIQRADAQTREAVLSAALLAAPLAQETTASLVKALQAERAGQRAEIAKLRHALSETGDQLERLRAEHDATCRTLADLRATWWYRLFHRRPAP